MSKQITITIPLRAASILVLSLLLVGLIAPVIAPVVLKIGSYIQIPQARASPDPATVATSIIDDAVSFGCQRKGFYAAGLFWAFYTDGTNAGWEFSADGITWTGAFTTIGVCTIGYDFSVWFDGTYVHYARFNNWDLFYRRGTPENDGSITWCDDEQTVYDGGVGDMYRLPSITVDTSGYTWIGVYNDQPDGDDFPVVLKNDYNNGSWATDFAYELSAVDSAQWKACPVPLTGGKVYVIYCRNAQLPFGQLWDGDWDAGEENDLADYSIEAGWLFSAVAFGDNVHFVYNRDVTYQIRHNVRVWGVGWNVNDVLVQDAVGFSCGPVLSADPSTGNLYCFWTHTDTDHVYYKQYTADTWDVDPTDWIDETTDDIQYDDLISSFYMDYGGYIGLLYVTKTDSPYNVKFAFLTIPRVTETQTFQSTETTTFTTDTTTQTILTIWTVVQVIIDPITTVTVTSSTYTTHETTTTTQTSETTTCTSSTVTLLTFCVTSTIPTSCTTSSTTSTLTSTTTTCSTSTWTETTTWVSTSVGS